MHIHLFSALLWLEFATFGQKLKCHTCSGTVHDLGFRMDACCDINVVFLFKISLCTVLCLQRGLIMHCDFLVAAIFDVVSVLCVCVQTY